MINLPPVRYSANQIDYLYEIGSRLNVYCDGVLMHNVVAYDCDDGWVGHYVKGNDGNYIMDKMAEDLLLITINGYVTAVWKP